MSDGLGPKTPPRVDRLADLTFSPRFAYPEQAELTITCGADDGSQLTSGYIRFKDAEIPWTVGYDEIILVLEGTLEVACDGGVLKAGPMETIWLPAGTELVYKSKDAFCFWAIQPSDWATRQKA